MPRVSVPGLACHECGTWTGMRRIPQECPSSIREWLERRDVGPLSVEEMKHLNSIWFTHRLLSSPAFLLPGDIFPPVDWKIGHKPSKVIYWPQFSNVVMEPQLFGTLCNMAKDSLLPIAIAGSAYIEVAFCFHSNVLVGRFEGNDLSECAACGRSQYAWSPAFETEVTKQESEKWMFRDNCLQNDIYLSHIFYPGFIATPGIAATLQDFDVKGCAFDKIEIRQR